MGDYNRTDAPLRTEFQDGSGATIAVVTCDNPDFLADLESRMIGTRASVGDAADAWVASATVTQGSVEIMSYAPRPEPAEGGFTPPHPAWLTEEWERAAELLRRWRDACDPDDGSNDAERDAGADLADLLRRVFNLPADD